MLQLHTRFLSDAAGADMMGSMRHGSSQGGGGQQGLPSPTLTNPDMVLPDRNDPHGRPALPATPPRDAYPDRPPSVTYLREQASAPSLRDAGSPTSGGMAAAKKEKRGLMSRKMMLLRSRTASNNAQIPRSTPTPSDDQDAIYASSPTLMDVGGLLPEPAPLERRPSNGTEDFSDEDLAGMPQFLAKYDTKDVIPSDDEWDDSSPAPQRLGYSVSIEGGLDEKRRKQEEDEQNSAILSKRAEAILANAKKRLNLMEGNLRGARDLVAPLTAANLKRATSVSSSHVTPASIYGNRSRPIYDGYHYDTTPQRASRKLQAQASSPTMGRDFHNGHIRGFSETEVPERPYTSMERTNSPVRNLGRFPVKISDPSLRGSRSYDSLGSHAIKGAQRDLNGRRGSPDSNLEPLAEDDGFSYSTNGQHAMQQCDYDYLGRSTSRTEDLREAMSSLRGRISSLKERAREDSLRRQSMQNLREPSPLNNASVNAPEYFYTSSPSYDSPTLNTNAGKGWKSQDNSPSVLQDSSRLWDSPTVFTGSRNAFAEQAQRPQRTHSRQDRNSRTSPDKLQRAASHLSNHQTLQVQSHDRTPSGTAIVQSSKHRYSHHQFNNSVDMPGAFEMPSPDSSEDEALSNGLGIRGVDEQIDAESEAGASEYEDAPSEQLPAVVAHEDREDAFDYEHFFLHSAMGTYGVGERSSSPVSSESASSVETAKGPTAITDDDFDAEYGDLHDFPPGTPETPEKLREIERNLHKRNFSEESISTLATFATATEGRDSPDHDVTFSPPTLSEWPLPPVSRSAPSSRPSTAIPRSNIIGEHRSDSSSERADSGVGLATSTSSRTIKHKYQKSAPADILHASPSSSLTKSPPMSPKGFPPRKGFTSPEIGSVSQNPATVVVNALLEPQGRTLGLRDKALLFGVVEQLRVVCRRLQDDGEGEGDVRAMQRRLEEAKRALDGAVEGRLGTS